MGCALLGKAETSQKVSIPMTEPRRLSDFAGRWQVSRHIQEATGATARFEGFAQWSWAEGGLAYLEDGHMTVEGHAPMQAQRSYFWADDLSVFFDDGRFFHTVPALGGSVRHWCSPDDYHLRYAFQDWPNFQVFWRVKGPRKDYSATTKYSRC